MRAARLAFLGPPGAGKGTQASLLSRSLGISHLSTGAMLRAMAATDTELGREVRERIAGGGFVSDELSARIVRDWLAKHPDEGFILDGFPRNLAQAQLCLDILDEVSRPLDAVVQIEVDEAEVVGRVAARAGAAIAAGEARRADDDPAVVADRIRIWRELTEPVGAFFASRGLLLNVDGMMPAPDVHDAISVGVAARLRA
ncbi:Adenylate kinase [Hyphomicrobiales bacterium]|nr:Adenylate kinase [Hyphomicrobiales bacterium]CAH1702707.1 Adenylate kinase [Hyphomicrobiales bacterium]CAI0346896.1 Adenylate kinase [Hyphomicrobiales bacterium]